MAYCRNHPNVIATGRCAGCAEEFCSNCLVDVQGQKFCGSCKVMALQGKMPAAAMAAQERGQMPNPLAKEALTYSLVGILCVGFILGPIAIVKGVQALNAKSRDSNLGGGGMAIAGIVIGAIVTLLNVLYFLGKAASMR